MAPHSYEPLSPRDFSDLMAAMFHTYLRYDSDVFPFDWLHKTPDLRVVCTETTAEDEDVTFPESTALDTAIQGSDSINSPESHCYPPGPDCSWVKWMNWTVDTVARTSGISYEQKAYGPFLDALAPGIPRITCRPHVTGYDLYRHHPAHWAYTLRDLSRLDTEQLNGRNHVLRSEALAATAIFHSQMNEFHWDNYRDRYLKPQFEYQGGPLAATIVSYLGGKVRVLQVTCDPSQAYPTMKYTLRGLYDLDFSNYDKSAVHKLVKWVLCPPDPFPSHVLPDRTKEKN